MRYHLDPVGGVAGDMFSAAMLDCHPEWQPTLCEALATAGLSADLGVEVVPYTDSVLTGLRFMVHEPRHESPRHRAWRDIRRLIDKSALSRAVRDRALSIFGLLAESEAKVHGMALDEVSFHELGEWDSIADIVCAAWLIDRAGPAKWTSAPLPMGRGRVDSAHGRLPVPAPAVTVLLEGFPVFDDGLHGERITPTGAAILRHLELSFEAVHIPMRLAGEGYGFGTKSFDRISNVLRILRFESRSSRQALDRVAVCQFEIDDQSPEDLSVGLENLRQLEGVLDVIQAGVQGKKSRLAIQVQVLGEPHHLDAIIDQCLIQTTTLGVRWQMVERRVVSRTMETYNVEGNVVRVKQAQRPGGLVTDKAEIEDLADAPRGHAGRQQRRRQVESMTTPPSDGVDSRRTIE